MRKQPEQGGFRMLSGLREHKERTIRRYHGSNIIISIFIQKKKFLNLKGLLQFITSLRP